MKLNTGGPVMACRSDVDGRVFFWTEPPAVKMTDGRWLIGEEGNKAGPTTGYGMAEHWTIVDEAEAAALLAEAEGIA